MFCSLATEGPNWLYHVIESNQQSRLQLQQGPKAYEGSVESLAGGAGKGKPGMGRGLMRKMTPKTIPGKAGLGLAASGLLAGLAGAAQGLAENAVETPKYVFT